MGANQSVHPISRGPQSTGRTRIVSKVLYGSNYTKANRMFVERGRDGKEACIVVQPVAALCCPYEFAIHLLVFAFYLGTFGACRFVPELGQKCGNTLPRLQALLARLA